MANWQQLVGGFATVSLAAVGPDTALDHDTDTTQLFTSAAEG
jgi:hypothetical protein